MVALNSTIQLLELIAEKLAEAMQAADDASEPLIAVLICQAHEVNLTRLKELSNSVNG